MATEKYQVKPSGNSGTPKKPVQSSPAPNSKLAYQPKTSRRAEEEKKRRREAAEAVVRRRRDRKFNLFMILIFTLIFTVAYLFSIKFRIDSVQKADDSAVDIQIFKSGSKTASKKYTVEETYFNSTTYLPITFLNDFFSITEFGDGSTYSFAIPSTGEWATFNIGTVNAVINGQSVSISANSFMKDGVLYLPSDFFHTKMNCFDKISYSSVNECNVLTVHNTIVPEFYSKAMVESVRVDKNSIPQIPDPVVIP